jgi:hypothetical protein
MARAQVITHGSLTPIGSQMWYTIPMSKRPWEAECSGATEKHDTVTPRTALGKHHYDCGRQCLCCEKYLELKGDVGSDYGVCLMPLAPTFGVVVFEHFSCRYHEYRKD